MQRTAQPGRAHDGSEDQEEPRRQPGGVVAPTNSYVRSDNDSGTHNPPSTMIWATLALLGIPIWLIVGALLAAVFNRRNFRSQEGVVPLLARPAGEAKWPRQLGYGRYVHNVLIETHGLIQIRTSVHVVEQVDNLDLGDVTLKKIDDPIAFTVRVQDGDMYEIIFDRAQNPVPVPAES